MSLGGWFRLVFSNPCSPIIDTEITRRLRRQIRTGADKLDSGQLEFTVCAPSVRMNMSSLTLSHVMIQFRAVLFGLVIGCLLCFTNLYFGLQTGWISMYVSSRVHLVAP